MRNLVKVIIICGILLSCKSNSSNSENLENIKDTTSAFNNVIEKDKPEDTLTVLDKIVYEDLPDSCCIVYVDTKFQKKFFPFSFKGFNSKEILKYFNINVVVDSLVKEDQPGFKYHSFIFKDSVSEIHFFVKSFEKDKWFYLDGGKIESNFLNTQSEIVIGMGKTDFFKKIDHPFVNCDIFRIYDGEGSVDYDFTFRNDKLIRIMIWNSF